MEDFIRQLIADDLAVVHEDDVLQAVAAMPEEARRDIRLWAAIRFKFVSASGLEFLMRKLDNLRRLANQDAAALVLSQIVLRSNTQAHQHLGQWRFGAWALADKADSAPGTSARQRAELDALLELAQRPRHSYAFTLDVHGGSNAGQGCGVFFCWLDPRAPLGNNEVMSQLRSARGQDTAENDAHQQGQGRQQGSATNTEKSVAQLFNEGSASGAAAAASGQAKALRDPGQPAVQNAANDAADTHGHTPSGQGGPAADGAQSHPLPAKYVRHIQRWSSLYGQEPLVFNGAQMAAAVREVSTRREFKLSRPYELPIRDAAGESPASAMGQRSGSQQLSNGRRGKAQVNGTAAGSRTASVGSLWDLYRHFATTGAWIQCVDIARLAILWLAGGGSAYVDTDMDVGSHMLPPQLTAPRPGHGHGQAHGGVQRWQSKTGGQDADVESLTSIAARALAQSSAVESSPSPQVLAMTPLLAVAQDADGMLQNNFLAVNTAAHPFLTLCLQAILLSAPYEGHVVLSTGPALITALYHVFRTSTVFSSGTGTALATGPAIDMQGLPAGVAQALKALQPTEHGITLVPSPDAQYSKICEALPTADRSALDQFGSLSLHAADGQAQGRGGGEPSPSNSYVSSRSRSGRQSSPTHVLQPLSSLTYGQLVHVLPPSAFYPRHWRSAKASGHGQGPARPISEKDQAMLRALLGSGVSQAADGLLDYNAVFGPDVDEETARELVKAIRERGTGGGDGRPHDQSGVLQNGHSGPVPQAQATAAVTAAGIPGVGFVAVSTVQHPYLTQGSGSTQATSGAHLPSLDVNGPAGVPLPQTVADGQAVGPSLESLAATAAPGIPLPQSTVVNFGSHGWDTTWGSYRTSGHGEGAGHGAGAGPGQSSMAHGYGYGGYGGVLPGQLAGLGPTGPIATATGIIMPGNVPGGPAASVFTPYGSPAVPSSVGPSVATMPSHGRQGGSEGSASPADSTAKIGEITFSSGASHVSESVDAFGVRPLAHRVLARLSQAAGSGLLPCLPPNWAMDAWGGFGSPVHHG